MALEPHNVGGLTFDNLGPRWRQAMQALANRLAEDAIAEHLPKFEEEFKQKMNDAAMSVICELVLSRDPSHGMFMDKIEVRLNA